jgi:hypothetical protein
MHVNGEKTKYVEYGPNAAARVNKSPNMPLTCIFES